MFDEFVRQPWSAETVTVLLATFSTLLFEYVPGFRDWFDKLMPGEKQAATLALIVVIVALGYGLSCVGWISAFTCSRAGFDVALLLFAGAVAGNQALHKLTKKPKDAGR